MVKTLTKHGNSYALIIDKPIMELLHITPETPLEISTDGTDLSVHPIKEPVIKFADESKFEDALKMLHERFGNAMKKLAE